MKFTLAAVLLFLVAACGGSSSPVALSGTGETRTTIQLESATYNVSWSEPDNDFIAVCQSQSNPADNFTIAVSLTYDIGSTDQKSGQKSFKGGGGTYACHISASAGSAWKITFTP